MPLPNLCGNAFDDTDKMTAPVPPEERQVTFFIERNTGMADLSRMCEKAAPPALMS
jgi:hypothetical protein